MTQLFNPIVEMRNLIDGLSAFTFLFIGDTQRTTFLTKENQYFYFLVWFCVFRKIGDSPDSTGSVFFTLNCKW